MNCLHTLAKFHFLIFTIDWSVHIQDIYISAMISHNNPKAAPKEAQPLTFPKHPHPYMFSILCPRGRQHHATRPKPPEGHTTPTNTKTQHKCTTKTLLNVILATANLQINTNHAIIASITHISRHNIPFPKKYHPAAWHQQHPRNNTEQFEKK